MIAARFVTERALAFERSGALRIFAALVGACHALTALAFYTYKHAPSLLSGEDCVCWPLLVGCERVRAMLSPTVVGAWLFAYAALGVGTAVAFATSRVRIGIASLVVTMFLGAALYALDYRMRLNQVYMLTWVTVVLLVRPRVLVLQVLVALFYFWAGTLKLDAEWTSGAALYAKPLLVPTALVPAACMYVVALELVLVWGLFARAPRVRWSVYAQLIVFHVTSFTVVGWYYPLLMFALTSMFPLAWWRDESEPLAETKRDVLACAAAFSLFQLPPWIIPGDSAVTGEGRTFALHMFDARMECRGNARIVMGARAAEVPLINEKLDTRTRCDPIVLSETTRRMCLNLAARGLASAQVDVSVDAKRTHEPELRPLVRATNVCPVGLPYSSVRHNEWIVAR